MDPAGNLYIADTDNHAVRNMTPGGVVSTLACRPNEPDLKDGPADQARFQTPRALAVDGGGKIFVIDQGSRSVLRKISPDGVVSTIALFEKGTGERIQFSSVEGISFDGAGTLYVADGGNRVVRKGSPVAMLAPAGFAGDAFRFTVGRLAEGGFVVEYNDTLGSVDWQPLHLSATGDSRTVTDEEAPARQRFYRVRTP